MVNLNECKIYKTEEEAQEAISEKFIEETMHLVEIAQGQAFVRMLTNIPRSYGT